MDLLSLLIGGIIGVALSIAAFFLLPGDGKLIVQQTSDGKGQYLFQIEDIDKATRKPKIVLIVEKK